jgi:hypothetical protein
MKLKLKQSIAILAILGAVNIFAADVKSVSTLVDKINKTTDTKAKGKLLDDLNNELIAMDPNSKDYQEAKKIVDTKLKSSNKS